MKKLFAKKKFACPCCGYFTLDSRQCNDICPICFWEDDPLDNEYPDETGACNKVGLNQARKNYLEFGACERNMLPFVRNPTACEIRELNEAARVGKR